VNAMARKRAEDDYGYPQWAEDIIPLRAIRAAIARRGLKRFEDDICQEVIIRLWHACQKDEQLNLAFGYCVLHSVLNNQHKKIKIERELKDKIERGFVSGTGRRGSKGPLEAAVHEELIGIARAKALQLNPKDQRILELGSFGDLPFRHIAELMCLGESTVRIRYHAIKRRLEAWADKTHE